MLSKALILDWRSLALVSCIITVFLSSLAVELIVVIVRLIRSGDCTIRERVRLIASDTLAISPLRASYHENEALTWGRIGIVLCTQTLRLIHAFFSALSFSTS